MPKIKDGKIVIDIEEIIHDPVILKQLSREAVFNNYLMEAFAKLLTSDSFTLDDDPEQHEYWMSWSGKGKVFEKMRQLVAEKANETAAKLIKDLSEERDKLYKDKERLQKEVAELNYDLNCIKYREY